MAVKTYNPKKVSILVGGVPITGFAKGTFVKVTRDEDTWTKYVGADGTVTRGKNNNLGGMIEITLAGSSPSNDMLSALHIADEASDTGVVPVLVKDLSGTTLHESSAAWVKKPADWEGAKDVTERAWGLDCADLLAFVGGNATSALGVAFPAVGV